MKGSFVTFSIAVESPGINNTTYLVIFMCTFRENSKVTKGLRNTPISVSLLINLLGKKS